MSRLVSFLRRFWPEPPRLSLTERLKIAALSLLAMLAAAGVCQHWLSTLPVPALTASMGASALLLFVVPHSPLAQPWPLVAGHLLSAAVGLFCGRYFVSPAVAEAVAVAAAILLMSLTRSLHPPGAATALMAAGHNTGIQALGYAFLLLPVLVNVLVLLVLALLINNLAGHRYPAPLFASDPHHTGNALPSERLNFRHADLEQALAEMNAFVDVSTADLEDIYQRAEMHAYRRKFGEVTCRDIMSGHVISVQYGTELEDAWALLRAHEIKALPVVDRAQRVIGIITLTDFLIRADLDTHAGFAQKLKRFIRRTADVTSHKPEAVGQIMTHPVFTLTQDTHIVELVPLLSDQGRHHVPIVDSERKLVGMVSQSDLIGALYRGTQTD